MAGLPLQLTGGFGAALLQSLIALGVICVLAWVVLRGMSDRRLFQRGRIEVLERANLDARRALFLVRVGQRVFLLGAGERASPNLLAELDEDELPELAAGRPRWPASRWPLGRWVNGGSRAGANALVEKRASASDGTHRGSFKREDGTGQGDRGGEDGGGVEERVAAP